MKKRPSGWHKNRENVKKPTELATLKPVVKPFVLSDGSTFDELSDSVVFDRDGKEILQRGALTAAKEAAKITGRSTIVASNGTKIATVTNQRVLDRIAHANARKEKNNV